LRRLPAQTIIDEIARRLPTREGVGYVTPTSELLDEIDRRIGLIGLA